MTAHALCFTFNILAIPVDMSETKWTSEINSCTLGHEPTTARRRTESRYALNQAHCSPYTTAKSRCT